MNGIGPAGLETPRALRSLDLIETLSEDDASDIVLVIWPTGDIMSADDLMAARVNWATKAGYSVLRRSVPDTFAPHNAVIRIIGTEDRRRDYLATLAE